MDGMGWIGIGMDLRVGGGIEHLTVLIMRLPTECRITFNMLRINEAVGMSYKVCSCRTEKKTSI